jgi:hypothetical protein
MKSTVNAPASAPSAGYPNKRTEDFFKAAILGDLQTLQELFESHPEELKVAKNSFGQTALDIVGTNDAAKLLLRLGMEATIRAAENAQGRGLNDIAAAITRAIPDRARG